MAGGRRSSACQRRDGRALTRESTEEKTASPVFVFLRALFFVVQLPLWGVGIFRFFTGGYLDSLTELVEGRPLLEVALFFGLASVPYGLCRLRLLAKSLEIVILQMAWLLTRFRGRFSVAAHIMRCAQVPIPRIAQNMLLFVTLNLFVNAVPDDFEMDVPKLLRFLDVNGDGTLEASEIEDWIYGISFKFLTAMLSTHGLTYLVRIKTPPEGWDVDESRQKKKASYMEKYWQLTAAKAGWWTLLDRVTSWGLYGTIIYGWLKALGIDARTVAAVGGSGGLALGLAAQKVVGNSVAALIILATSPCRIGDEVESGVPDLRYRGVIKEIGWNATVLIQEDGAKVYVPNGTILSEPLVVIKEAKRTKKLIPTDEPMPTFAWKGWPGSRRSRLSGRKWARTSNSG